VAFDGHTLERVAFSSASLKKATFRGTILRDVSFHHCDVKHTDFGGATMDKITYALLRGGKANLDSVHIG
jgi:uncharacterized protein YjbI with pentapeptide repeats